MISVLSSLPAVALALAPHDVHVVDDDPGLFTDFTTIQAAIDAALDGDAVLVRPGTYAPFQVAKGVDVLGVEEGGQRPSVQGDPVLVHSIASSQAVVVRGLDLEASLRVQSCDGPVLIEDVEGWELRVEDCADVVVARIRMEGGAAPGGAVIVRSALHAYDSVFRSADSGQPGIWLSDAFAFLSGVSAYGGKGAPGADGTPFWPWCFDGGTGGPGLYLSASSCTSLDCAFLGGPGGPPGDPVPLSGLPPCDWGPQGPAVSGVGLVELPGLARGFEIESPGVEGGSIQLAAHGVAGEFVYVFVGTSLSPLWFAPWAGTLAVSPSSLLLLAGVVPGSGALVGQVGVGQLGLGIEGVRLIAQPVFVQPAGGVQLGPPTSVELVDGGVLLVDCNGNGVQDSLDIATGTSADCDGNGVPDECDIAGGAAADCNGNGVPDACDLAAGTSVDLYETGQPDECDVVLVVPDQHPTIQAAVNAAPPQAVVLVRDGVYTGPGNTGVIVVLKQLVIRSENGPASTTIVVPPDSFAFRFASSPAAQTPAKLIGFTIRDAASDLAPVRWENAPVTIRDCRFLDNATTGPASAVYAYGSAGESRIEDCVFQGCTGPTPAVRFVGQENQPQASLVVSGSVFDGNQTAVGSAYGPALDVSFAHLELQSSAFVRNVGRIGALRHVASCAWPAQILVNGTTFSGNDGSVSPAVVLAAFGCPPATSPESATVQSSILWGNTVGGAGGGPQADLSGAPGATVLYTTVEGGQAGIASTQPVTFGPSVVDQDPLFVSLAAGNVHLSAASPCIDAGDPAYVPLAGETDFDGEMRVFGPAIDMGADEDQP